MPRTMLDAGQDGDEPAARLQRLERALDSSLDGYWERDLVSGATWYSPSFAALFGFAPGELPNDRAFGDSRIHPDDLPDFLAAYEGAIEACGRFDYRLRYLDRAGRWRWVRGRGRAHAGADGRAGRVCGTVSDMQAEQQALQRLADTSGRLERALAAADEGLIERFVDEDAMAWSDRAYELLGYPPGSFPASRQRLVELIHPDDRGRYLDAAQQALAAGDRLQITVRMRHGSGEWRWIRQRSRLTLGSDGRLRATGMIADVHEQTIARAELEAHRARLQALVGERTASLQSALALAEQRRREAEEAAEAKARFLAHMSHEIRTPLNGVLGLAELALQAAPAGAQRRWLELALQSGQTLLRMVNNVLDHSRLQAGHIELQAEAFDAAQSMADALRSVMPLAQGRPLRFYFDWIGEAAWVVGDEMRLLQIVTNLLGNAVKFTAAGHVALVGETQPLGDGRLRLRLRVEDSGPGIAPERRDQVFDAFVQGDARPVPRAPGSGLGLAISRTLARAMGAELVLADRDGGGTVFTLTLTLPRAPDPAGPLPPVSGSAWVLNPALDAAAWTCRRLERLGLACWSFGSLAAAVEEARALPPSHQPRMLLLAAAMLERESELEALRRVLPATHITLVIRPEWNQPALEARALALRIGCATVPLTPRELAHLAQPLPDPRGAGARAGPAAAGREPDVLLVDDNPVNLLVAGEFLSRLGARTRNAADGEQALAQCLAVPPVLALMDVQMPGMDGLEATRRLRQMQAEGRLPVFPILALTAYASETDRLACLAAGMDDCLTKPIALDALRAALDRYLPSSFAIAP